MKNKKRKQMNLQTKIIFYHLVSSLVVILSIGILLYFSLNSHMVSYVNAKLANKSQLIGHIWLEESEKDKSDLRERMDEDMEVSKLHIAIFNAEGKKQYSRKLNYAPDILDVNEVRKAIAKGGVYNRVKNAGHLHLTYLTPFYDDNRLSGFVFLGDPMTFRESQNRIFMYSIIFAVLGMTFPVLFIGKIIGRNILRSIKTLERQAQNIDVNNLQKRVVTDSMETEFIPLAKIFDDMCDRLRVSVDNIKKFTSDASHQLRTPLTIVKGELEGALRKDSSREEYIEAISNSLDEIHHLKHVVDGLLFLSRSESNQKVFFMTSLSLRDLVAEVAEFAEPLAGNKNIAMSVNLNGPAIMNGDKEWLRQFVFNLLDNSIKYCSSGDEISVSLSSDETSHLLSIKDTGPGICPDHLPHVFERFYVAPGTREKNSVGLGLSICKWVVHGHNGKIDVVSAPGEGTSFKAYFPQTHDIS